MKKLTLIYFIILSVSSDAQQQNFSLHTIKLPLQLAEAENQFSGLYIAGKNLYLMPECRIQDKHLARIYSVKLGDIEINKKDSAYVLPFETMLIYGLDSLAVLMKKKGQEFEGLEAFIIRGQTVYFSVETTTPSSMCFLLKGSIKNGSIYMSHSMTAIRKPLKKDGNGIYNAGFEAITLFKKRITAFYEYNYFDKNFIYTYKKTLKASSIDSSSFDQLPFRITDITATGNNHFTALNYFYKGNGGDTVYRLPSSDNAYQFIHPENIYTDYNRLIDIEYSNKKFSWKTLWIFPKNFTGYNWEGIAAYKKGYFIINDKFTMTRPYSSVLLYLEAN